MKLFHSGYWNRRILFLLVCFAFSFCHVLAFVRYIGLYILGHHRSGLLDCVRYNEEFVISRFFPIHFTVTLAGLKSTVRYTDNFIISLNRGSTVSKQSDDHTTTDKSRRKLQPRSSQKPLKLYRYLTTTNQCHLMLNLFLPIFRYFWH